MALSANGWVCVEGSFEGTLSHCMDIAIQTGSTKAHRDSSLTALSYESVHGETVVLLIEVRAKNREAKTFERECELIVKHALLDTDGEASERLDGTLKELNGLLKGLLVSQVVDDVHMIVGILDRSRMLHVSHAGRAEAYLIRSGLASQITEYTSGKSVPAFVHIASGQLDKRDTLILSTQRLLRTMTPAQLAKAGEQAQPLETLLDMLDTEGEQAALATIHLPSAREAVAAVREERPVPVRRGQRVPFERPQVSKAGASNALASVMAMLPSLPSLSSLPKMPSLGGVKSIGSKGGSAMKSGASALSRMPAKKWASVIQEQFMTLLSDLKDPKRRKRAHLLLLAIAVALLIVIWATTHLFTSSQRSKTKSELESLVKEINTEVQTADNRRIIGDIDAANAILTRAEEKAKQVMDNESGLYRMEALDLLDKIRAKKEEINNIVRLSPRAVANIAAKSPDVIAQAIIGVSDGEFAVVDRQSMYRVLLNSVDDPLRITDQDLILDGAYFDRFQSPVLLTKGNSVIEVQSGQPLSMKTEDPAGWVSGIAVQTYLRFLYVLSPEKKQIYKYERMNNRYGSPVEYNVSGDLTGALDFAIDGEIYVLKDGGTILKLLRGENQNFVIRKAPENLLKDATKIFKVTDGNFYLLDPSHSRVIVLSDGGPTGEAAYLKQYVLEGEQVSELKDLYVDSDDGHLYVLDAKRVHVIDLTK